MDASKLAIGWIVLLLTLAVGAWLVSDVSGTLLTPLPGLWMGLGIAMWLASGVPTVMTAMLADKVPRLVRRLLVIGALATAGWSMGTLVRSMYAFLSFAGAETTIVKVSGQAMPVYAASGGAQQVSVYSFEVGRSLPVWLDAETAAKAARSFVCVELAVEQTAAGVARLVVPDAPLGAADLIDCPAVQAL